jgi:hypothetical protein
VQAEMQGSFGYDFSNVNVHSSAESGALNQQLGSKAFTTGQDIFFNEGAYEPNSSSGKELLAHELTHVVQQGTGQVKSSGGMTVNAPGDEFEVEANSTAGDLDSQEEKDVAQMQEMPEEELQTMPDEVQMQEMPEEELQTMPDEVQMQEELEDELQTMPDEVQMQEELEDELQTQLEEDEEDVQMQVDEIQMQDELPEEEL